MPKKIAAPPPAALDLNPAAAATLRAVIADLGLSRNAFAIKLGYKRDYIFKMLNGSRPLDFGLVGRVLKVFGAQQANRIAACLTIVEAIEATNIN